MPTPYYQSDRVTLYHGDCLAILPTLAAGSVDAVVTSPPYAEQRKEQYGGIPEAEYPEWTAKWMDAVPLAEDGNVLLNIREHVSHGQISDYVHRTRLTLRGQRWNECDELIWIKPHSMPVGHPGRPRRSWERVLWFSRINQPRCYPKNNGKPSDKIGIDNRASGVAAEWSTVGTHLSSGIARCRDYVEATTASNTGNCRHPAMYPVPLAEWLVRLVTNEEDSVLDPFTGSGTTGVACIQTGRKFIGIEIDEKYCEIAAKRIQAAEREASERLVTA